MSNPYQSPNPYQQVNAGQMPGQSLQNQPQNFGQPAPMQQGYGQPAQMQQPGQFVRPYEHPQETTVMILAIVGIFTWICAPIAWVIGNKAKKEMVAQGMEPTSRLKTWTMVGMVFTILGIVGIAIYIVLWIILFAAMAANPDMMYSMAALPALAAV